MALVASRRPSIFPVLLVVLSTFVVGTLRYFTTNLIYGGGEKEEALSSPPILATTPAVKKNVSGAPSVGYAIAITKCTSLDDSFLQGAAVLQHSIHVTTHSSMDHKLYAIVLQEGTTDECVSLLERMGYHVLRKSLPVSQHDVATHELRVHVRTNGCCGDKEFLKLYAYTLVEHDVVIYLDVDALLLQPLDDIIHVMTMEAGPQRDEAYRSLDIMYPSDPLPEQVNAMFTRDYDQVYIVKKWNPRQHLPVQGGFFAVRPDMSVFEELCNIVKEGNYSVVKGWGKLGYGGYWGTPQIQGLLSYYYSHVHPNTSIELHNCHYNNILGDPTHENKCTTMQETCEDCRTFDPTRVKLVHPVNCHKFWKCTKWPKDSWMVRAPSCRYYKHAWAATRKDLELKWAKTKQWTATDANGGYMPEINLGYCEWDRKFRPMRFTNTSLTSL